MRRLKIIGYGTYLPDNTINFGNQTRYRMLDDDNQVKMCAKACINAIKNANLDIKDIDLIICASAIMAQLLPATSALIHEIIANDTEIPAIDINTSCTSFITALDIASYYLELDTYKNILIVAGDAASKGLNINQKESYELFSDSAAALVVTKGDNDEGVVDSLQKTYSYGAHLTEVRGGGTLYPGSEYDPAKKEEFYFDMKGPEVLLTTARLVPKFLNELLEKNKITLEDIDMIVPHQASQALGLVMSRFKVPKEKYIDWVSEYGNMVSGSVPFVLCKLLEEKRVKKGDTLLLCGTAAGLTINGLILKI
jgi:3-oxoacyl-[acyl-carrier-protein] synthase-3